VLKQFLLHLSQARLATREDKVLLAVSGGLDSMVMLHLFAEAKFSIAVAHVNFQLRSLASDTDEAFVKNSCEQRSVPFFATRFNTQQHATEKGLSIQMAARELRYTWFDALQRTHGFTAIATAHHANDSLETILLHLVHGSSLQGFGGIPVRNGSIIRPLLFATRQELEHYASENNIAWREDSSNKTDDYARNFIRHRVVPLLKEVNPSLEETFLRGQRRMAGELSFFAQAVQQWKDTFVRSTETITTIEKEGLKNGHASLLYKAVSVYGFNFDVCEEVMGAMNGQSGKRFLSSTHELTIDRQRLIIAEIQRPLVEVSIAEGQAAAAQGIFILSFSRTQSVSYARNAATVDASKLNYPLCWRPWREGDYFYPLGMEHKKKLSDFLIDAKVPLAEKAQVTVLESNGEIVWVVGLRLDHRYRVTEQTSDMLLISVDARR
jgi:tRNA(Ile)-lysidine synthase